MSDWPRVPLIQLAADEASAISKPYGSAIVKDDYTASGVPVVRGINLARGRFHDDDFVFISEATADRMPGARLKPGDLVITHRGSVGQVSMIPRTARFDRYATSTSQVKARLDSRLASPEFVYYWFQTQEGKQSILDGVSTVGVPGLAQPVTTVKALRVPMPPLPEQQAIAEVLGALDDKIAANVALATTADRFAVSLLLRALSTDRVRLDSVARITMGSSPKGETLNEASVGVPFYQGVRDFGFRSPVRRVFTTSPVRSAEAGDILVSVRAPVGDVNVANEALSIGRGIAALKSTTGKPATLFHQLRAERDVWKPFEAEGTVFGSINRRQLNGVQVRPVALEFVNEVEQELSSIEASIAATIQEGHTLAATRDALLPQLMSGRIRVRDAEVLALKAGL